MPRAKRGWMRRRCGKNRNCLGCWTRLLSKGLSPFAWKRGIDLNGMLVKE